VGADGWHHPLSGTLGCSGGLFRFSLRAGRLRNPGGGPGTWCVLPPTSSDLHSTCEPRRDESPPPRLATSNACWLSGGSSGPLGGEWRIQTFLRTTST